MDNLGNSQGNWSEFDQNQADLINSLGGNNCIDLVDRLLNLGEGSKISEEAKSLAANVNKDKTAIKIIKFILDEEIDMNELREKYQYCLKNFQEEGLESLPDRTIQSDEDRALQDALAETYIGLEGENDERFDRKFDEYKLKIDLDGDLLLTSEIREAILSM